MDEIFQEKQQKILIKKDIQNMKKSLKIDIFYIKKIKKQIEKNINIIFYNYNI